MSLRLCQRFASCPKTRLLMLVSPEHNNIPGSVVDFYRNTCEVVWGGLRTGGVIPVAVDNVARYVEDMMGRDESPVPSNYVSPFREAFYDFQLEYDGLPAHGGMYVMQLDRDRPEDAASYAKLVSLLPSGNPIATPGDDTRFVALRVPFGCRPGVMGGWPHVYGCAAVVFANDSGDRYKLFRLGPDVSDGARNILMFIESIVVMSTSFAHCKNVKTVVGPPVSVSNDRPPKNAPPHPRITVRTLAIDPGKEQVRRDGERAAADGRGKALHICRGHFATYTEDRPLFGHTVGTVWRPQHARGREDRGTVAKDYRVLPPS